MVPSVEEQGKVNLANVICLELLGLFDSISWELIACIYVCIVLPLQVTLYECHSQGEIRLLQSYVDADVSFV